MRTPEAFREQQGIQVFLHRRVVRIDRQARRLETVCLRGGERSVVPYDRLVVATGARSRRTGLPGEEAENFFTLKDLQDAIRIKEYVNRLGAGRAAVLGAGYIGLEMAEAFVARGIETSLYARGERPAAHLEPEISAMILEELRSHGVGFEAGCFPLSFRGDASGRITGLDTRAGAREADLVLCALGVVPNTELLREAGIRPGETGAVWTDPRQATEDPLIFAAGDCCQTHHRVLGRPVHLPLGDVANKQGRVAGENAAGGEAAFHGIVGSQCFKLFSLQVASTGVTERAAREHGLDAATQKIQGNSAVHYMPGSAPLFLKLVLERGTGRILGAHMAGREGVARRINTLAVAVQAGLSVGEVAQMDFAYAPHFSPPFDPILVAAEQALKRV